MVRTLSPTNITTDVVGLAPADVGPKCDAPAASIVEIVQRTCARLPNSPAYSFGRESLTYFELDRRSNRLARHLRSLGVGRDSTVGVYLPRDLDLPVALIGIMKAGGAYLPLDPSYPSDRIRYILEASETRVVVSKQALPAQWLHSGAMAVHLERDAVAVERMPSDPLAPPSPEDLAYVIFTSGSTGKPKGVEIPHRAAANFLLSMAKTPGMSADDVIAAVTTICFDISVLELLLPLVVGGRAEIVPPAVARDARDLARTLASCGATMLQATPATWRMLLESGWQGDAKLKALCGGEALAPDLAERLLPAAGELWNMYGPTETTVWSTCSRVVADEPIRLGQPIADTQLYIVDEHLKAVERGEPGELLIGGAGVARGYRNRPELTAERFVDTHSSSGRVYRTGDLVRMDEDGRVEFLGRIDHQVKINGFRIELGEIEAVIQGHPRVAESVVVATPAGDGERRLAAYFVPRETAEAPTVDQVGEWESLWSNAYEEDSPQTAGDLEFSGWNSSYTGERIAVEALQLWAESTAKRIRDREPMTVLDVGCGVGHFLTRIAPSCERYVGVDLSPKAVESLRQRIAADPVLADVAEVGAGAAHDLPAIAEGRFDAVLFNSVVQYFPSCEYLVRALDDAADSLSDDGFLFVGDVRLREWAAAFHASVALHQAADSDTTRSLADRIAHRLAHDPELLIDARFFEAFASERGGLAEVSLELKRGRLRHELADFRVDAVLARRGGPPLGPRVSWESFECSLDRVRRRLSDELASSFVVTGVPNARLEPWRKLLGTLSSSDRPQTVGELRSLLASEGAGGVEPEEFWQLAAGTPYRVSVFFPESGEPWTFDAVFEAIGSQRQLSSERRREVVRGDLPIGSLTSDPLWGKKAQSLASQLRDRLRAALPDYMTPASIIPLPRLPRAPNGKIDRAALPEPFAAKVDRAAGRQPGNETERRIQRLWEEMLGVQNIAVDEDFFQLTGTSLTAVRMLVRLKADFGRELPLAVLLERPTIEHLAKALDSGEATRSSRTVVMKAGADLAPLFVIHGVDGSVLWAYDLVRRINPGRPVLGVQAPGLEGECPAVDSIDRLADMAVEQMRDVHPTGPYHMIGWCFGGILAQEIAVRLHANGGKVGFVGLVDTPCYIGAKSVLGRIRLAYEEKIQPNLRRLRRRWKHLASLSFRGKIEYVRSLTTRKKNESVGTPPQPASDGGPIFTGMRGGEVHDAHIRAMRRHVPGLLPSTIDLLNAEERAAEFPLDSCMGWPGRAKEIRLHHVPGDHNSLLKEPNVAKLASVIDERISED